VRKTTCHNNRDTIDIINLINKTCVINSDQVIDIFGEVPILDLYQKESSGFTVDCYLGDVNKLKTGCGHRNNTTCSFDNVRFHYSDPRHSYIPHFNPIARLLYAQDPLKQQTILEQLKPEFMKFYGKPTWKKDLKDSLFKMKKQIDNTEYPELRSLLVQMNEDILEQISFGMEQIKNYYEGKSPYPFVGVYLTDGNRKVNTTFAKLLDVYILSRMFRTFTQVKDRYSDPPKNIIIYAGDFHSQELKRILTLLGFQIVFETSDRGGSLQCLDISNLQQPLFSSHLV
jgi:hypothetical protein